MIKHEPHIAEAESADEALRRLVDSNIYIFGHGTLTLDAAEGSVADGLHTRHTDLFSTAEGLPTVAENPRAFEHNREMLWHWPHHDAQYVVVLGVERLEEDDIPHRRYLQSIVQPRQGSDADNEYDKPYIVDRRFVAGYFDTARNIFVRNPDFDPHYDPALLQTTVNYEIQRELHPVDPRELIGGVAVDHRDGHEPSVRPAGPPRPDDPVVW